MKRVIELFIGKIKDAVSKWKTAKNCASPEELERWYAEQAIEEERSRRQAEEDEREYRKEQDKLRANLEAERLEEERAERLRIEDEVDTHFEKIRYRCQECGELMSECLGHKEEDVVDETTLIRRQCAESSEEEEIPLWLEQANTLCPDCGLLPEFCQCQFEE